MGKDDLCWKTKAKVVRDEMCEMGKMIECGGYLKWWGI